MGKNVEGGSDMTDMENAQRLLREGGYTCVACKNGAVHTATERGVRPLLNWLDDGTDLMGASVAGASWQLARPFLLLCLLAAVLSMPLAIKGSQMYLELFPNRIGFPWWLLVVSVLVTLLIAFLSICWHTLSVARRNPVESIKTE
jgi:hypothetical protein